MKLFRECSMQKKSCTLNKESKRRVFSSICASIRPLNMGITTSDEHRHIYPSKSKLFLKKRMVAVAINYWPSFCLFFLLDFLS